MANILNMSKSTINKYISLFHDWHMHTFYTDGQYSVEEMAKKATEKGLISIAITEHIRKKPTYSFEQLVLDIKESEKKYELKIFISCEAKVLNINGEVDVTEDIVQKCDFVLGAFHKFPVNKEEYFHAILGMLNNPVVNIWAHPFRFAFLNNINFNDDDLEQIFEDLKNSEKIFEINLRFPPSDRIIQYIKRYKIKYCFGSDSHQKSTLLDFDTFNYWINKLNE